ncbi:type III PLP-dependent enzyme [Sulfitobacter mediterraneus]|uniref:type III PLP-dependent enzyme n=1 Tax=Sulfitobacter TaxID=60136 RepID=UPI0019324837|nr:MULTISPECIES: type III PLP-dependent enzyme [Sulfitobacter]MBM1633315.1 type III PLP-dependent enzyme [Sulfitobacter mediterraneus]MBM1640551.1 type III PLP-dependent enzyme [Sulfitobacter mediterraneus]MBM1645180.1 type III PLP-dependent enzyme [Sulfitobacter mediterraneus]MBM1648671.1 type III PLP-dependent enzyme [Sulfitobacter mediterraneus]MBM1652692.1 type III PLP-dependent enzyme [Sulfitobacter mediterraneus]
MTMNATLPGALRAATPVYADPAVAFIAANDFDRPTLVISRDRVAAQYDALHAGLGRAHIHYAVKANPAPEIIRLLVKKGSGFDAASRAEIELCLSQGAKPANISFGNTIKRASDIAFAHSAGVSLFAADSEAELDKIAAHAPGARVYIRLIVENSLADWPLSRKFGCAASALPALLDHAKAVGLVPFGLSFHVGSQTRKAEFWNPVLDQIAPLWKAAIAAGHELQLLNLGGGFPAFYGEHVEAPRIYAASVMRAVAARFGDVPQVMAEPGRGLVAEAGHIAAEVMLVSRKSADDLHRWVYLDIGRFSGLAETEGEAIRYQFVTKHDGGDTGPCILAGPSCDSADILYEKRPINLPMALACGDKVVIRNCGAYTSSYSSVGFNGFPPLDVIVL